MWPTGTGAPAAATSPPDTPTGNAPGAVSDELAAAAVTLACTRGDMDTLDRIAAMLDQEDAQRPTHLPTAALGYAERGILVFPLRPGEKRPATRNGFKDATVDPDRVRAWWQDNPAYNIGAPAGVLWDCIDVDVDHHASPPKPNGYLALADLIESGALPEVIGRASTPRGGAHLYVPVSGRGNKAGLVPGIDYRGAGGFTVLPPSYSAEHDRRWTWHTLPKVAA